MTFRVASLSVVAVDGGGAPMNKGCSA